MIEPVTVYTTAGAAALVLLYIAAKLTETAVKILALIAALGVGFTTTLSHIWERPGSINTEPPAIPELPLEQLTEFTTAVFSSHLLIGMAAMALIYITMETWYPATLIAAPGIITAVAALNHWLATTQLQLTPGEFETAAYAAAAGFTLGLLTVSIIFEPVIPRPDPSNSSGSDPFRRLNL